jgi:hypothetical protein
MQQLVYVTSAANTAASVTASCTMTGTTYASCVDTLTVTVDGQTTQTTATYVYAGVGNLNFGEVPITAGINALSVSSSCTGSSKGAAPTVALDVYKVLAVPAAAVMAAGAFL